MSALGKSNHSDARIISVDIGSNPPPAVSFDWVVGSFAPPEAQTSGNRKVMAVSDSYVEEFLSADLYVFAVPIYNLNIPLNFKAYIDQIVRVGKTFGVGEHGYIPLVHGKKLIVISASGGSFKLDGPAAAYNFHEPYLRAIFGFIGETDVHVIYADNQNMGKDLKQKGLDSVVTRY